MSSSRILQAREGRVVTLTLNRPELKNALDRTAMEEFAQAVASLEKEEDLGAVVLTGAGEEAFCAGGDLRYLETLETGEAGQEMSRFFQGVLGRLERLPVPVICAINGYALGGGAEITLACDLRVMAEDARLAFRQVKIGLMTGWGGGARLERLVGRARALELLLTAEWVTAERALALGLVNALAPRGQTLARAQEMAAAIAANAPLAVRALKRLLTEGRDLPLDQAVALESELFREVWASADHAEGVRAFFEKRNPRFQGR
ncbi:MAG: enoyl-CoA hydratase/isomerase family protein [Nitrospinota bacterium]